MCPGWWTLASLSGSHSLQGIRWVSRRRWCKAVGEILRAFGSFATRQVLFVVFTCKTCKKGRMPLGSLFFVASQGAANVPCTGRGVGRVGVSLRPATRMWRVIAAYGPDCCGCCVRVAERTGATCRDTGGHTAVVPNRNGGCGRLADHTCRCRDNSSVDSSRWVATGL